MFLRPRLARLQFAGITRLWLVLLAPALPLVATLLGSAARAEGVLLRVPDDYPTVAAAVTAAVAGQTVAVRAGTYVGQFTPKSNVDVLGGYDPIFVVRDPDQFVTILIGAPRVINCTSCGAGAETLIDGFTMRTPGSAEGSIVYISNGSPTLSNCRFENAIGGRGGAMSLVNSSTQLLDNTFVNNTSSEVGGALAVFSSNQARIIRCTFQNNRSDVSGGGIFFNACSGVEVRDCTFKFNLAAFHGGGVLVQLSTVDIVGSMFSNNMAVNGAGIGVYSVNQCNIINSTLFGNQGNGAIFASALSQSAVTRTIVASTNGAGLAAAQDGVITNTCCDVWNNNPNFSGVNPGPNTFGEDPRFCDPGVDDFHLLAGSPCAPGSSPPGCDLIGAFEVGCGGAFIRVPDNYPTVSAALEAASAGDTVGVAEGHYVEHVTLKDRVLLVGGYPSDFGSRDPIAHPTILDAGAFLSTVVAQTGQSPNTVIDGFVITGGNRPGGYGGGLDCFNSSPTVRNNVFTGNRAKQGGAIACRAGAAPLITGNVLTDNYSLDHPGGAIYLESAAVVTSNTLDGNRGPSASGLAVTAGARPTVARNIVVNGAGIGVYAENGAEPVMACNDVWMNIGGNYFGVFPGANSMSLDPLFCSGTEHGLSDISPCAPENAPAACGLIGARGVVCVATTAVAAAAPPVEPWLGSVAPNPAAGRAALAFGLPMAAPVLVTVHDATGRRVRTLLDGASESGEHQAWWDGRTDRGGQTASGVYFFRLEVAGRTIGDRKLVYLH